MEEERGRGSQGGLEKVALRDEQRSQKATEIIRVKYLEWIKFDDESLMTDYYKVGGTLLIHCVAEHFIL